LRLARFNVETDEEDTHEFFSGLPSPAAAGTLASFPIGMRELTRIVTTTESHQLELWLIPGVKAVMVLVTFAVACLMVSRIRYPHVFNQWVRGRKTRRQVIHFVFVAAVFYWVLELAFLLFFCYFAFAPPLRALWTEAVSGRLYRTPEV
jgi:CDP-diacylglycerol--serine O-phosphatidyltransferase